MESMKDADRLDEVETLSEAVTTLREMGFTHDLAARNGLLHCELCDTDYAPSAVTVEHVARFEGTSDPGDESIVFGISMPCGHRGIYTVAYGTYTPTEDVGIVRALHEFR